MGSIIRGAIRNPYAVVMLAFAVLVMGGLTVTRIPIDILPIFKAPAVQILTFYGGMPAAGVEKSITNRMERGSGMASGVARQESRSIVGVSLVRNYFHSGVDGAGALTESSSLAQWEYPAMPPGTLPPVILPYDPTSAVPVSLVALDSRTEGEQALFDVARYEVRNMLMSTPGATAPVVYGGKVRAVMLYLDRIKMLARGLSPTDVMQSMDNYNVFLPTGSVKLGDVDYAVNSNSMFEQVEQMKEIPLRNKFGNPSYLGDVAEPQDASFIQTNIVRVNGRRQVYVPVYRQRGASTLAVVDTVKKNLPDFESRLSRPGVGLKLVMDQSVYVRSSIASLVQEGMLGAILCSLVVLVFLGEIRMTLIAVITIPLSVLAAVAGLYAAGQTINVMTLAGLALSIGPLVDNAIICLENTHRHMSRGVPVAEAAYLGASEVSLPALVATLCTFLVLTPLIFIPGMGEFLFGPMTFAVFFAMIAAFVFAQTLVPSLTAVLLKSHGHGDAHARKGYIARMFERWEAMLNKVIGGYTKLLGWVLRFRVTTIMGTLAVLAAVILLIGPRLGREFFPEVDAGAFDLAVRAPTGTRVEETEKWVEKVENAIRETVPEHDLQMIVAEIGVSPDISSAYTPNAGPMDAIVRVQLNAHRSRSAQEYVRLVRSRLTGDESLAQLEFSFDSGGMVRSALNEGKASPLTIQVTGKDQKLTTEVARQIKSEVTGVPGIVDARIIQRQNYPQLTINVDRSKAAALGLTQQDVMRNVVAACNSSIAFNKRNFWIDPVSRNQYYVGVSYDEKDITDADSLLDIPITSPHQTAPVPLRAVATLSRTTVPSEITHSNIQPTIDLTMNVDGRSLGDVANDVKAVLGRFGEKSGTRDWATYDPRSVDVKKTVGGSKIVMAGEFARMEDTFSNLGYGLILAVLLMYILMVSLARSFIVPLTVVLALPVSLIGVIPVLYFTGTNLNVQSLLGIIFVLGVNVANTVLLTDFAQTLRRDEFLSPTEAIRKAAAIRVRPVTMTALAAFFAMVPAALALERGSEANAPLARAILGGLVAGGFATLFVLPAFYSLMIRDGRPKRHAERADANHRAVPELAPA